MSASESTSKAALVEPPAYEDVMQEAGATHKPSISLLTVPDVPRPRSPPPSQVSLAASAEPSSPFRGWRLRSRSNSSMSSAPSITVSKPVIHTAAPTVAQHPAQPCNVFSSIGGILGALFTAIQSKHAAKQIHFQEKRAAKRTRKDFKRCFHHAKREWKAVRRERKAARRATRHMGHSEGRYGGCSSGRTRSSAIPEGGPVKEYSRRGHGCCRGCQSRMMTQVASTA